MSSSSSSSSSSSPPPQPPLKRIKLEPIEHSDGPLACTICLSSIRVPGVQPDALKCEQCSAVVHRVCADKNWSTACVTCQGEVVEWKRPVWGIGEEAIQVGFDDSDVEDEEVEEEGEEEEEEEELIWEQENRVEEGKEEEEKEEKEEEGELSTASTTRSGGNWLRCGIGGCAYKCKQYSRNIKRHKAHIHGIDIKWWRCDQCAYKCKENGSLKRHKACVHGIDVQWFPCDQCVYRCKQKSSLKAHIAHHHQWLSCDECNYKSKTGNDLRQHKASVHGFDAAKSTSTSSSGSSGSSSTSQPPNDRGLPSLLAAAKSASTSSGSSSTSQSPADRGLPASASSASPALNSRVEVLWEGEGSYFAGLVVCVAGSRARILYDDGEEGVYEMADEIWRPEGETGEEKDGRLERGARAAIKQRRAIEVTERDNAELRVEVGSSEELRGAMEAMKGENEELRRENARQKRKIEELERESGKQRRK